ncbi:MAG TPA: hypothetical protein PLP65_01555 [Bacteroidales bacterium]|nr:hypothetical protein [Bacteroidales bacterium]
MGGGVIALLTISCMAFMPQKMSAQYKIKCESATTCDGWLFHNNKIGIGTGWGGEAYIPRTTLHLHEFNSMNTYLNITNQTTGFPSGSQTLGMFIGMTGNKATITNFQNDNLVLATGTTERLVITPNGNTGVGISTPQNVLHIHKAIGTIPQLNENLSALPAYGIQLTNNNTGTAANSGLLIGLTANGSARIVQQGAISLSLGVNNGDVVNINSTGNVGIGTNAPSAKLHTKGTVRFESLATATVYQNQNVLIADATGNVSRIPANLIGDNLGNHTASQNIKMNDQWLSNDGDAEGIKINNRGDVLIYGSPANGTKTFEQNNGLEIVTRGRIPERRGISIDEDANGVPAGNLNFWIHNWQNPAAFNFMRNDQGSTTKLTSIDKNGNLYVSGNIGVGIEQPSEKIHILNSTSENTYMKIENTTGSLKIGLDGVHSIINTSKELLINWYSNNNVVIGGEQSGNFATLHNTFLALNDGKVGIKTTNPQNELDVNGTIHCKLFKVDIENWYDNVFEENYPLYSIDSLKSYIKKNKHLPEIPSESEIKKDGMDIVKINSLLVKYIEELTLYIISLKEEIDSLKH